jgi:hypothetical protein
MRCPTRDGTRAPESESIVPPGVRLRLRSKPAVLNPEIASIEIAPFKVPRERERALRLRKLRTRPTAAVGWSSEGRNHAQQLEERISGGGGIAQLAYLTDAFELAKAVGADTFAAHVAVNVAINESSAGEPEAALRVANDLLASQREPNSSPALGTVACALANTAQYLIALGCYDQARVRANEAIEFARELGLSYLVTASIKNLAVASLLRPQVETGSTPTEHASASRLLGYVEAYETTLGFPWHKSVEYNRAVAVLRNDTRVNDLENLMAAGATMTEDEAIAQAHALV